MGAPVLEHIFGFIRIIRSYGSTQGFMSALPEHGEWWCGQVVKMSRQLLAAWVQS